MVRSVAARLNAAKAARYRARLRRQGLRLVQIWVPDTRSPRFAAEAHRQSLASAASRHAKRDMDFVEAISAWTKEQMSGAGRWFTLTQILS